jgi:hypothetical protein
MPSLPRLMGGAGVPCFQERDNLRFEQPELLQREFRARRTLEHRAELLSVHVTVLQTIISGFERHLRGGVGNGSEMGFVPGIAAGAFAVDWVHDEYVCGRDAAVQSPAHSINMSIFDNLHPRGHPANSGGFSERTHSAPEFALRGPLLERAQHIRKYITVEEVPETIPESYGADGFTPQTRKGFYVVDRAVRSGDRRGATHPYPTAEEAEAFIHAYVVEKVAAEIDDGDTRLDRVSDAQIGYLTSLLPRLYRIHKENGTTVDTECWTVDGSLKLDNITALTKTEASAWIDDALNAIQTRF